MSEKGRRDFLKSLAWVGAGATCAGNMVGFRSAGAGVLAGTGIPEMKYAPLKTVKVGIIGLGMRGPSAVQRLSMIPGVEIVALCDLIKNRAERQRNWLVGKKKKAPAVYGGTEEAWKALCDRDDINLVYITTPWKLHTPMCLYAMEHGKHAVSEVPIAVTVEECWQIVETSERTRRHCMMLENCCYGDSELFALMLCRKGVLGQIVHGEGGYLHSLADLKMNRNGYQGMWRLKFSEEHDGDPYPTHGLGPICMCMDINRGDKMDYLVSVSSGQFGLSEFANQHFGKNDSRSKASYKLGDVNTTIIKTSKGRTIMVQHNTTTARPYSRINSITGTKGILSDYPLRVALGHGWMNNTRLNELHKQYLHPLWKRAGDIARKQGGHGGMDFLMDLRLCYCLQNGLPLDISVYDSATWSSLVELSERSTLNKGQSVEVPDFTRGAWKTTKPWDIISLPESFI